MIRLKIVSTGAILLLLSACGGGDVASLRTLEPVGSGYNTALAHEYKDFALYEADEMGDVRDADRFALKAMAAARGENPPPEELKRWNLPVETQDELKTARKRLMATLDDTSRNRWPVITARAMARFDCWIEQLDENFQPTHIAACRDGFYKALFEMENPLPTAFISFFDLDDATLKGDGADAAASAIRKAISGEIPAAVRSVGDVRVLIGGHADRSGSPGHNYRLSLERAKSVRNRLIVLGVPAKRIIIRAYGETQPLVKTPDGVSEQRNRRVEITIILAPQS